MVLGNRPFENLIIAIDSLQKEIFTQKLSMELKEIHYLHDSKIQSQGEGQKDTNNQFPFSYYKS